MYNLRDDLTPAEVFETINTFEKLRPGDKNVYVVTIILANWNAYKEASKMYPTLKERFLEIEQEGWLQERDIEKAKEIARTFKANNVPVDVIIKGVPLTRQEVEAL